MTLQPGKEERYGPGSSVQECELPTEKVSTDVDVVLPVGGQLVGAAPGEFKALLRVGGETLLSRTVRVLRETGQVRRMVAVGPAAVEEEARRCGLDLLPGRGSVPENIQAGLEWLQAQAQLRTDGEVRALVVAADLPFLTPEAISTFLDACPAGADLTAPVLTQQQFEARFPGSQNQYVRLRDGAYTIGSAFLLRPDVVARNQENLRRVFEARKSQLGMVRLLGPLFVLRFLSRRLTVGRLERRCGEILGFRGAAVLNAPAELAFDIDIPAEYEYAAGCYRRI